LRMSEQMSWMRTAAEAVWRMRRDIVSDGYDEALHRLATNVPMTIHEYPTGTECFTWIVPEKWTCRQARLETLDGKMVFSDRENPLHVMSYSLSFSGEVTREVLFNHLHTHKKIPEAVPFIFKYYERDWGLCCSQILKNTLADEKYRVIIESEFSAGTLKVGEVLVQGQSDECYVFCAHLCHPHQFNDDLAGVLCGLETMRQLAQGPPPRFSYRLLILPETIGSAAWLSHNESLIPSFRGGLFLEMLATSHAHAFQSSFSGDSDMDQACRQVLAERDPDHWEGGFLKVVLNDERMFNGPGVRVPMASLSRILPRDQFFSPYREYHSDEDSPKAGSFSNLEASCDLVMAVVNALERNLVPIPLFKGEIFCSRYKGIEYKRMAPLVFSVPYLMDGNRTVLEIADESGQPLTVVLGFLDVLVSEGLARWSD
ncbi:MAG: DUF4910 domain-containing protein, partial [Proteobacteria bacterium]|nr:DUF4910 domain-containing protein [Pseudomonadota bacterium]